MEAAESPRVVVVGGGKMGEAILAGWLASDQASAAELGVSNFVVVNPGEERRAILGQRYGVACLSDVREVTQADIVVLAVKPQVMAGVLSDMSENPVFDGGQAGPLFISIAAGLTTARLQEMLPAEARLVRTMPNMPLQLAVGATAVTAGAYVREGDVAKVLELFAALGVSLEVAEEDMDAVCAISGSGPAYVAAMIEALTSAGVSEGLSPEVAESLALQTVLGTALLIDETGQSPEAVRKSICSPGGTTLAALSAMEDAGFDNVFSAGVAAAVRRSKELASC